MLNCELVRKFDFDVISYFAGITTDKTFLHASKALFGVTGAATNRAIEPFHLHQFYHVCSTNQKSPNSDTYEIKTYFDGKLLAIGKYLEFENNTRKHQIF